MAANFNFVIDSSFKPFTFEEAVKPLLLYREAYDKAKEEYESMGDAEDFSYLLNETTPKDDPARKIYESYINERNPVFEDFSRNGLSLANQRSLLGLKSRYRRDIGRLKKAQTALDEERKLRRQAGSAMLWADDDLKLSSFLDNNLPNLNLYGVSRNDIYAKGVAKGKAYAARKVSMTGDDKSLGKYYIDFIQRKGYSAEDLYKFRDEINAEFMRETSSIPELQRAAQDVLDEMGVNGNLTGANLSAARSAVISGIMDGAIYEENHNPVANRGVMSAAEAAADADRDKAYNLQKRIYEDERKAKYEFEKDTNGTYKLDEEGYPIVKGYSSSYLNARNGGKPTGPVVLPNGDEAPDGKTAKEIMASRKAALSALTTKNLNSNNGFTITYSGRNEHFNYIGLIHNTGFGTVEDGKGNYVEVPTYQYGKIGSDVHNRWLGFTSSSNVMNYLGDYSMERIDRSSSKVLSDEEYQNLIANDPNLEATIDQMCAEEGLNSGDEYQVVQVPNESESSRYGYAIAISDAVKERIEARKKAASGK